MTGSFTTIILSNIDESDVEKIFVYPNPVKELMHINGINNKDVILQIYNVAGLLLIEEKTENVNTLNLKNFDS
jgi:hypothetical protein